MGERDPNWRNRYLLRGLLKNRTGLYKEKGIFNDINQQLTTVSAKSRLRGECSSATISLQEGQRSLTFRTMTLRLCESLPQLRDSVIFIKAGK